MKHVFWGGRYAVLGLALTWAHTAWAGGGEAGHSRHKPSVLMLLDTSLHDAADRDALAAAASRTLHSHKIAVEVQDVSGAQNDRWPRLSACAGVFCQAELCQQNRARQLWTVQVVSNGEQNTIEARIYDAALSAVLAERFSDCVACSRTQLAAQLSRLFSELYQTAKRRKTGLLEITSNPPGATVRLNGTRLGTTPIFWTTIAGEHWVELSKPGFAPYQIEVTVEADRGSAHDATLAPDKSAPPSLPHRAAVWPPYKPKYTNNEPVRAPAPVATPEVAIAKSSF